MLQTLLSIVLLASLVSLAVAAWRLAVGASVARVSAQLSATGVIAGLVAALGCSALAVASGATLTAGLGLVHVGLTPNVIENERAVRVALAVLALGAVLIAVAAARLRTRHSFVYAIAADLSSFGDGIRTDWQRLRSDEPGRTLLPALATLSLLGIA
ncbi:MAG: hypothetical protein ACREOG_21130, partial [Gemmatimonadaceae bacterium]